MPIFDSSALNPGVRPREVWSWAGYDFANSGYTTVVLTAVFSAYFVSVVANDATWATPIWTVILAVSNAAVMLSMPIIGAYADVHARKQWLLRISTIGCVLATAALALAGRGDLEIAVIAVIISNFFFQVGVSLSAHFCRRLPALRRWAKSRAGVGALATWADSRRWRCASGT